MTRMKILKLIAKKQPQIYTVIAITGVITSIYSMYKVTPRVNTILEKEDMFTQDKIIEITKATAVPMASCLITVGSILMINRAYTKQIAALLGALSLSKKTLAEYKDIVKENFGSEAEASIDKEAGKRQAAEKYVADTVIPGTGRTLCMERFTGRLFYSSKAQIRDAVNELNQILLETRLTTLNDFYSAIGLSRSDIGETCGWEHYDDTDILIRVAFDASLTGDGIPILVVYFTEEPCILL